MGKIGDLRQALLDLLQEHERDGALPTSARFLYFKTRATLRVEQGAHRRAAAALLLPTRALFPMLS
jgi:hypothetical protein